MSNTKTIIISGCGFKYLDINDMSIVDNVFTDKNVKINIGAATAYSLAQSNYNLILISRTISKLELIRKSLLSSFPNISIKIFAIDLLSEDDISKFVSQLDFENNVYYYVHCAGISAGSYKIKDDNPYLSIEDTPLNLPTIEFESVVKTLLIMIQALLPVFKKQLESRMVIVSSMSGIRAVPLGFSHVSAKAGLHNATRSLTLELNKLNIFISEVLPGAVDTGLYDNDIVKDNVRKMGESFGYSYSNIPMMPPKAVADAVKLCIESESHILSINLVAQGQWPNLSA
ncbi:MAG: SDR family oxidoreductase [Bacteroidales bacterium]|jgi:short-subunit dehydrogenase|nr:SDR family oxidoreductase [Bacteroidales bacterium]